MTIGDPPAVDAGMRTVVLDGRGRLQQFNAVPPRFDTRPAIATPAPWEHAFAAAGLEMSRFVSVVPQWTPPNYADTREAWEGPLPDSDDVRVHVEASAYRGAPVSFTIVGPWTTPEQLLRTRRNLFDRLIVAIVTAGAIAVFVVAGVLARRNLNTNRADRRGAVRLAWGYTAGGVLAWLLGGHHAFTLQAETASLVRAAGEIVLVAALLWTMYVALEPYVRRLWPDGLLGWSRLLAGHIRDPRVGRDVLIGVAGGTALGLIDVGRVVILPWLGYRAPSPTYGRNVEVIVGAGALVATWMTAIMNALQGALIVVLVVVLVRLTLRRVWLSAIVAALLLSVLALPNAPGVSHWAAAAGNWTIAALTGLVLFGLYAARAGRPLFEATKE